MNEDFQHRLVKARSGHGWSQAELAEVSGIAPAQISRYEQGKSKPRTEVIAKLAKALAVGFDWLAYGKGEIEAGFDVPEYPSGRKFFSSIDLDEALYSRLKLIAESRGITVEMALHTLLSEALDDMGKGE
ncbi:helix-turn-helix domain-containing protein [Comamonas odontotermitis]|uniref:helix-turn-helix domain-containing protein n=1 Tax=Comamonas odontotermitis TaxID=379895 RepID=UPI001CC7B39D|nr:helix-turn-helix transcriptional regulator [Comamonas odontotermitis]UBB17768.1 helix-turn-helix transcriptional regulator [Comamonas odontotermitis]